ncbi:PEP-utilizing enzyme, TIM barrel domain protein [Paenibacillus solani]|uniref:PEP-utilizing enzyme, TIM barrel domain protein n=1 Tax=Paenibacillus solani TaxID=1705565 RepID=UPI003D2D7B6D
MTQRQWGAGNERLYEHEAWGEAEEANGFTTETDLLKHFAMAGGVTHEEVLLLLASPDDIEEALRVSGIRHSGKTQPALNRLLQWSDRNRRLKVMSQSADADSIIHDLKQGAQGIGLIRGEEALRHGLLQEVYSAWIQASGTEKSALFRRRLITLWKTYWVSVFQAAKGNKCAVSMLHDEQLMNSLDRREAQDAQLESLFRAMEQCSMEGTDCQLELLATRPSDVDEFISIHRFIEEVAEQTLMDQKRFVRIRYGVLLDKGMNPSAAAEMARLADVIVLDAEGTKDPASLEGNSDRVSDFSDIISRIRRMKPQLTLRFNGAATTDLRMIYRQGIHEVCCQSSELAAIRITGARLEMRRRCSPLADG